ncbi:MAG: GNAT family N-acetyltransferase [Candidatus Obscuribacter sp.]|nr:GNAT family N-acetyltransferase [Candidatus Obscuribacter sp.]
MSGAAAIKGLATLGKSALETGLGQTALAEIKEGAAVVAAKAGVKLSQEAMEIGAMEIGAGTASKGTIQTMSDLFRRHPGEVVTAVPRRYLGGGGDGIKAHTLSIDILHPDELFTRVATQRQNANLFGTQLENGIETRRLHYLNVNEAREQAHVTLSLGNRIAGIGGVRSNRMDPTELWVDHISVEAKHQGKGYARHIIESIYDYAQRRNQQVVPSGFTTMGQRLKPIFMEMNERYPSAASPLPFRNF